MKFEKGHTIQWPTRQRIVHKSLQKQQWSTTNPI